MMKCLWFCVYLLCEAISEKFKCTGNCYNIRRVFKTKYALMSSLMRNQTKDPNKLHTVSKASLVNVADATVTDKTEC